MKSRIVAAAVAALLIAASGVVGAGSAQADDFTLVAADLTATESTPYSAGWFQGNVTGTPGTISSSASGLTATGGQFQLLNGTPGVSTGLAVVGATAGITMSAGTAAFQIPVFAGTGGTVYTTLYADASSIAAGTWYTSNDLTALAGADAGYVADSAHTLAEYEAAFDTDYEILAFGFNKVAASSATVASLSWNGDTYWFLPAPTATVTPTPITPAAVNTTGVTFTASGFIPGEDVEVYYGQEFWADLAGTTTADANGAVSYSFAPSVTLVASTYGVGGLGLTSDRNLRATLTVAEAAAGGLANTGTETALPLAVAGVLLLGGIAAVLVSRARRIRAGAGTNSPLG